MLAAGETAMRIRRRSGPPADSTSVEREASNLKLTTAANYPRLGNQLDRRLGDLIEGGESLGIGFVPLLRHDHVGKFSREIHVRLFYGRSLNRAVTARACLPNHCGTGRGRRDIVTAAGLRKPLIVAETRDRNLAQRFGLVVGELAFDCSVGCYCESGERANAKAILASRAGSAR